MCFLWWSLVVDPIHFLVSQTVLPFFFEANRSHTVPVALPPGCTRSQSFAAMALSTLVAVRLRQETQELFIILFQPIEDLNYSSSFNSKSKRLLFLSKQEKSNVGWSFLLHFRGTFPRFALVTKAETLVDVPWTAVFGLLKARLKENDGFMDVLLPRLWCFHGFSCVISMFTCFCDLCGDWCLWESTWSSIWYLSIGSNHAVVLFWGCQPNAKICFDRFAGEGAFFCDELVTFGLEPLSGLLGGVTVSMKSGQELWERLVPLEKMVLCWCSLFFDNSRVLVVYGWDCHIMLFGLMMFMCYIYTWYRHRVIHLKNASPPLHNKTPKVLNLDVLLGAAGERPLFVSMFGIYLKTFTWGITST